jgi:hypothetical protein
VTDYRRGPIESLAFEMDEIVLAAGGRFYLAKDSTLRPSVAEAYLGKETIAEFKGLKAKYDPEDMLQTDLWRRIFAGL